MNYESTMSRDHLEWPEVETTSLDGRQGYAMDDLDCVRMSAGEALEMYREAYDEIYEYGRMRRYEREFWDIPVHKLPTIRQFLLQHQHHDFQIPLRIADDLFADCGLEQMAIQDIYDKGGLLITNSVLQTVVGEPITKLPSIYGYSMPLVPQPTAVPQWWTSVFFPYTLKNRRTTFQNDTCADLEEIIAPDEKVLRRKDYRTKRKRSFGKGVKNTKNSSYYGAARRIKERERRNRKGRKRVKRGHVKPFNSKRRILFKKKQTRPKFVPNSNIEALTTPKALATLLEEAFLGLWTAYKASSWTVLLLEMYRTLKALCPEYAIHNSVEQQLEWLKVFYDEMGDKTWTQISEECTRGLRSWESFAQTSTAKFLMSVIGYGVIGIFHPTSLFTMSKTSFDSLCWRFKNFRYDPGNLIGSMWALIEDALHVVKIYNETGSWETALVRDSPYLVLQTEIASVKGQHVLFKAGNLAQEDLDEREYLLKVDQLRDKITDMLMTLTPTLRRGMELELKNANVMYHEVLETTGAQLTKFKPWCVLTLGKSQIGKTVFNQKLVPFACSVMDVPSTRKYMYSIPEDVNFWDGFRSYKTGLTYDDIANLKCKDPSAIAKVILRVCNNEPLNVEQADIELKGRVWCNARVLGCTTNIPSLNLHTMIEEHVAIMNRFRYHIEMIVKPEYKHETEDKLDVSKLTINQRKQMFPDVHYFTVYKVHVTSVKNDIKKDPNKPADPFKPDFWSRKVVEFDGVKMENITVDVLLKFLASDILTYKEEQESLLENAKLLDSEFVCKDCNMPIEHCCCAFQCQCGAQKELFNKTHLCMCGVKLPKICDQFGDTKFGTNACVFCRGDEPNAPCICKKKTSKQFIKDLDKYQFEHIDSKGYFIRDDGRSCLLCTGSSCGCASNVGVMYDIAVRDWRKAHMLTFYLLKVNPEVIPESLHYSVSDEFSNNISSFLHNRLLLMGTDARKAYEDLERESDRFLIAFLEHFYRKFVHWVTLANAVWPLALIDPKTPSYTEIISNSEWGKNLRRWVHKFVKTTAMLSTMCVSACSSVLGYYYPTALFTSSLLVAKGRGFLSNPGGQSVFSTVSLLMFPFAKYKRNWFTGIVFIGSLFVYYPLLYDVIEGGVYNVYNKALRGGWFQKINKFYSQVKEACTLQHNHTIINSKHRFALATRATREALMENDAFSIVADNGPGLVTKLNVARGLRMLFKHLQDFRVGFGIRPNAGFAPTLEEALTRAHKYADESYIIAYQQMLEEEGNLGETQSAHLLEMVKKQTYALTNNGQLYAQALAVKSNTLLMCAHSFIENASLTVVRRVVAPTIKNCSFTMVMRSSNVIRVDGDKLFYYCSSVGTVKDLTKYLSPEKPLTRAYLDIVYREPDGKTEHKTGSFASDDGFVTTAGKYIGRNIKSHNFSYIASFGKPGTSGAPIFTVTQPPRIIGLHTGSVECTSSQYLHQGNWVSKDGNCQPNLLLLQSMLPVMNAGVIPTERYGQTVLVHGVSEKSIMFRLDRGNFAYHGRTPVMSTFNQLDGVVDTPIASEVQRVFGAKKYSSPKLRGPEGNDNALKWIRDLNKRINPHPEIDYDILEMAFKDYISGLPIPSSKDLEDFKDLNKMEILNGRLGVHGMESMNFNGSVGEPINKPLKMFCKQIASPNGGLIYELEDVMFWNEVERMKRCYERDERSYPIFAMFPKIEPTPVDKDKVRNILNPEIAHKLLARETLLPILCFLERYRYESECAVGINPYGVQWDEFYKKFRRFYRCYCMDHSGYDLKMSPQIALATYCVKLYVNKLLKRSPKFDQYVRGIATDASYPLVNVAGEMVELRGSFTSGSVETTVRNSIANSLLMRCAYFLAYRSSRRMLSPLQPPPFRSMVFLEVYGDDNAGDVDKRCYWFNMTSIQHELGQYGYVLTDANKSATLPKFVSLRDVDFLKRSFGWNKELNLFVGILCEDSILKRLVAILKPTAPNTVREITLQNVDSALDEWWLYGELIYERKRKMLKQAIIDSDPSCLAPTIDITYHQRHEMMKKRAE